MPITSAARPRGRRSTTSTTADANALVSATKRTRVTTSPCYSTFRTPHSALCLPPRSQFSPPYIRPLLLRSTEVLRAHIPRHQLQHRFHFLRGRAGVERAAQVRVQLLGRAQHGDRRHGGELAPLQVEP